MCLILVAKDVHSCYPLIIIANREEYHSRPTQSLSFWHDHPTIAAGRDLTAGGTWFGLNLQGLFAAVTNFQEPTITVRSDYSRGMLALDWLRQKLNLQILTFGTTTDFSATQVSTLFPETLLLCGGIPTGPVLLVGFHLEFQGLVIVF